MYAHAFWAQNAPACIQRAFDLIITKYKWKTCLLYLDDFIVLSCTMKKHIKHVEEILIAFVDAGVTIKIKKCHVFKR